MTHDSSHPFHKLARAFAAAAKNAGGNAKSPGGSAAPDISKAPTAAPAGDFSRSARRPEAEDDDAALFLDAVSRIKALPGKARADRPEEGGLGKALAARMRALAGKTGQAVAGPQGSKKAPVAPSPAPSAALSRHTRNAPPAPDFSLAMRALFDDEDAEMPPTDRERELFAKAMRGVRPVNGKGREVAAPSGGGRPLPVQDPARALRDLLEGRVRFALHHTDEFMEGYVVGVDPLVLARLRGGQYSPEKHLDLHGKNARQAYEALTWFIRDAYQRGMRCVVVVTGRGRNSPDGVGVLRSMLQRWLSRDPFKRVVLAFCTARPEDGGPGAVYVLLRRYKKSRGKIIWEHSPSDEDFPDV